MNRFASPFSDGRKGRVSRVQSQLTPPLRAVAKRGLRCTTWIVLLICLLGAPSFADEIDTTETRGPAAVDETHPIYSTDAHWVGIMLVAVAGLFLAAAVIGPIVRAEAPDVVPVAMSHEEDPAADRAGHDGKSQ